MQELAAHYDGKHVVLDEPVDWPKGQTLRLKVEVVEKSPAKRVKKKGKFFLGKNPVRGGLADASENHDKYIYTGT